jgi:DASS family divalent anion:Na+ symporter
VSVAAEQGRVPRDLLVAALAQSPVLANCTRQELSRLVPFLRERRLAAGETLYRAGEPAQDMWVVLDGTLKLTRADDSSQAVSSGLVGEEAALGLGSYLSDVVALEGATVAALGRDVTPAALRGDSGRAQAFCRSLIHAFAPPRVAEPEAGTDHEQVSLWMSAWKSAGWLAAIAVPVVLLQLFESSRLRWEQQQLAAVLASTAMLWIFGSVQPYVAGLLVILVCVTLGIVPTKVVLSGYASNGFFLALSMFSLGAVLVESGAINRAFLLLMKRFPRSTIAQDGVTLLSGFLLTPLIVLPEDRARVLGPLAVDWAETSGQSGRDRTRVLLTAFMGFTLFSPMFLMGGSLNLMLYGSLPEQLQDAMPALRWSSAALAATVVMVAAFAAGYAVMFPRRAESRVPARTVDAQLALLGPMRVTEWVAVGGVLLFVGAVATVSAHKIDHRLLALAIICGYLALGTLGKDQLNLHIDWSRLLLLGAAIGLVTTIIHVGLHTVIASHFGGLSHLMQYEHRTFIALLAVAVVAAGLVIPHAGALIGTIAIPLAMNNGMSPWVVLFVILLMSDIWFRPYQSESYRIFRDIAKANGPFDERAALRFNLAMTGARVLALVASVFYLEQLRVL